VSGLFIFFQIREATNPKTTMNPAMVIFLKFMFNYPIF